MIVLKYFVLLLMTLTLSACYETTANSYSGWKTQNPGTFTSEVRPYSNYQNFTHGYMSASSQSQADANKLALDRCAQSYARSDCFVYYEGNKFVWTKNVEHLVAREKLEKKQKELARKKKQEEAELALKNQKRNTCTEMGFQEETEGMANCILQLTLQENNNSQVVSSSNDDGMLDAMNEQNSIMKKQLRIQRQQNIRQVMKRNQCILNNLNDWYTKC